MPNASNHTFDVKPITIVTGGQYGSEAKGAIAGYLTYQEFVDIAVRTGATNAGHTVEFRQNLYAMQQLPVAWIRPNTKLVLGAGAIIDPVILLSEIRTINAAIGTNDIRDRIYVDHRAYIHRAEHRQRASLSGRHHAIGATGKGCSEAVMDRVRLRGQADWTVEGVLRQPVGSADVDVTATHLALTGCHVLDTSAMLNDAVDGGAKVLLEGCQGTLLDLHLGPYPFTTHKQTTPAQWMSEAGLSPRLPTDIVMVVRTKPIRVAGNSGPLPLETSWPQLARSINLQRSSFSQKPIVPEWAIVQFETAVRAEAAVWTKNGQLPVGSDGLDQHLWSTEDRETYRAALSEIHKGALGRLSGETLVELRNLFEMTTVTKKLRRVASLDRHSLRMAARQVRPHRVAVTFMNYVFPAKWFSPEPLANIEQDWLLVNIIEPCEAPVFAVNRGPHMIHVVPVGD